MSAHVVVLMSSYNGEAFIAAQIDSILTQRDVTVTLIVRDDGSSDRTPAILDGYAASDARVRVIRGANMGAANSFLDLSIACDIDAPFYAFSDQDDVWRPEKLAQAVQRLTALPPDVPALHASCLTIVDRDLNVLGRTPPPARPLSFENALVQGGFAGTASMMNRALFRIFRSRRPERMVMHDGWLYLVAAAFGTIIFDERAPILYRQHGSNIFGAGHGAGVLWQRRLKSLLAKGDGHREQAAEFMRLFGEDLPPAKRAVAERFVHHRDSIGHRLAFVASPGVAFNSTRSRALFLARAALGRT